jgi:hypothetical protein
LPVGPAQNINLRNLIGKRVGIIGEVIPHPPSSGALVEFKEINSIE